MKLRNHLLFIVCCAALCARAQSVTNPPGPPTATHAATLATNATQGLAPKATGPTIVYVIPVEGPIDGGTTQMIEDGLEAAERAGAKVIVLDMDTPGGRLYDTEEIVDMLLESPMRTFTFVNSWAISAGAIISLSTEKIYMRKTGIIGDAMPIMIPMPGAAPVEMSDDLKEKMVSPTEAMIRKAAQQNGHDPELAACMVRRELEYKIGDKVICKEGELLTLTAIDATQLVGEDQRPLLAAAIVSSVEELLEDAGISSPRIVRMEIPGSVRVAKYIQGSVLSTVLLALGLLLVYIEFKIPGFGAPGVIGLCLLSLWFWANTVNGVAGMTEILMFGLGVALILIEIFLIPGFGFTGIAGILLIVGSLLMAMFNLFQEPPPVAPSDIPEMKEIPRVINWAGLEQAVARLGVALVLSFAGIAVLAKYLPRTRVFGRIALTTSLQDVATKEEAEKPARDLKGMEGTAATALRPAGIGVFDNERLNVVTRGEFLAKDTPIVVAETHGNRIVVEQVETPRQEA